MAPPKSVDAYLKAQPAAVRAVLARVRAVLRKALPGAEEVISYGIPAYRLHGTVVIFFAGWKQHYSLYPVTATLGGAALAKQLAAYDLNDKGTIRFPLDAVVPAALIARLAKLRAKAIGPTAKKRR